MVRNLKFTLITFWIGLWPCLLSQVCGTICNNFISFYFDVSTYEIRSCLATSFCLSVNANKLKRTSYKETTKPLAKYIKPITAIAVSRISWSSCLQPFLKLCRIIWFIKFSKPHLVFSELVSTRFLNPLTGIHIISKWKQWRS